MGGAHALAQDGFERTDDVQRSKHRIHASCYVPIYASVVTGIAAGVGCSAYAFVFTYVMLKVIDLITPVRVGAEAEEGLDASMHGESAYALGV